MNNTTGSTPTPGTPMSIDTPMKGKALDEMQTHEVIASFEVTEDGGLLGNTLCAQLPQHFASKNLAKRALGKSQVLLGGKVVNQVEGMKMRLK